MPLYEFQCRKCLKLTELVMSVADYTEPPCDKCGGPTDQVWSHGHGGFAFKMTYGRWTGLYDYDYGSKATWDLSPPGKIEELKKAGRIADPFEEAA